MRITSLLLLSFSILFPLERGGFGGFSINLLFPDVDEMNQHFRSGGIPSLSGRPIGIGGSGFALINRILIGGSGYSAKEIAESDSIRAELSIGSGEFKIGYGVLSSSYLNLALSFGFGGAGYKLSLRPLLPDVNFDDLLKDPRRYVDLEFGHFLIHPECHLFISIPFQPFSFFHIGLSGGINLNLFTPEWSYDNKRVLNGPKLGTLTPVFSINFLFGGGI
ncbi:hypothetical protein DRP53_01925 [candidate division WOR-3 bacterium]|uniref:Outer membrane protein beta-barrel domain-containing protein n=1 Tax=candidate division WOR-3 bacterium TaxID=2052148 RepID=A0A660SKQ0_UNCW3|nr:MAG: hypothetical protein DRP53_01925 [candidate division WOR-3 bacterium]